MAIEFEEPTYVESASMAQASARSKQGPIIDFLLKKGFAKDAKQANTIMIVIAVCFFALTLGVIIF